MKELKIMLETAIKISNVKIQKIFFLDNIGHCIDLISAVKKIGIKVTGAHIERGILLVDFIRLDNNTDSYMPITEYYKRIKTGVFLEYKKMPKKKLNF